MISHVTMRHMVPVSSPADVKNKLAVMKRFNADHARDPARNCAFTDAHLVRAAKQPRRGVRRTDARRR